MKFVRTVSFILLFAFLCISFFACSDGGKNYEYFITKSFYQGKVLMECRAEVKEDPNESKTDGHTHSHDHIHLREDFAITDSKGKEILGYDEGITDSFMTDRFIAVKAKDKDGNEKCALVDSEGKIIIPFGKYRNIQLFDNKGFGERTDGKFVFLDENKKPVGDTYTLIKDIKGSHYIARYENGKSTFADFGEDGKLNLSGNPESELTDENKKIITEFFDRFFIDIREHTYTTQAQSVKEFAEILQRVDPKLGNYKPTKLPPRDFLAWVVLLREELKNDAEIKDIYCVDLSKDGYSKGTISFSCSKYTFTLDFLLVSNGDNTFRLEEFGGSLDL